MSAAATAPSVRCHARPHARRRPGGRGPAAGGLRCAGGLRRRALGLRARRIAAGQRLGRGGGHRHGAVARRWWRSAAPRLPRPVVHARCTGRGGGLGAAALVAMGLPARQLLPGAWSELATELDRGLAGIRTVEWPYAGDDEWVRLRHPARRAPAGGAVGGAGVLAGAPRARRRCCALALVALLAAVRHPGHRARPGRPAAARPGPVPARGGVAVAAARERPRGRAARPSWWWPSGCSSLPLAGRLDARDGGHRLPVDGTGSAARTSPSTGTTRTGPLDWPREGTTLLKVEADRAAVLEGRGAGHLRRPALGALALRTTAPARAASCPSDPDTRWDEQHHA